MAMHELRRLVHEWRRGAATSPYWLVVAGSFRTSPRLAAALAVLTVLAALMPTAVSLAAGRLAGALPGALPGGPASGAGPATGASLAPAVTLLGLLFVLQQVVAALRWNVGSALGRRFQAAVQRRVMRAALRPRTILHLEDPALLDTLRQSLGEGNMNSSGGPPRLAMLATERLSGAAALLVLAHFSPWLALLLAAAWLHHLRRLRAVHRELIAVRWRRTEAMRDAEYLGGLPLSADAAKEVRVFGLGHWFGDRFEQTWLGAIAELWARRRGLAPAMSLAALPVLAAEVLALALIGRAAALGQIDLGALVVYAHALFQAHAFGSASDSELAVQYSVSSLLPAARLERLVQTDSRLALSGTRPAGGLPREAICFEGVTFRYPGRDVPVFERLSLRIPAGRSLAIVGANGAGKTTLIKLLCRLYEPAAGRITVDGLDLGDLDPRAWQGRFAAIFQDFQRYALPAHDNVAFGAPGRQRDRELVRAAARRAGAVELIESLPLGWDTVLSRKYTGGADLSGGQWQRVALARALFAASCGASILVLDEPTAQLDVRAEAAFYDSFLELTRGLTTIVISHRFSTVRRADRIVVLEQGGVVEEGSHDALMRLGKRYAHLFTLQAQRFGEAR